MVYIGNNGKAASVSTIKIGDENGKARRIWSLDRPMWKFTCQNGVNLHVSGSGLAIDYGDGASENIGTQFDKYHISHTYADEEPHQVTLYGVLTYLNFWDSGDTLSMQYYLLSVDTPFPRNRIAFFNSTFRNCQSLTSIPAGLFDNCTAVADFSSTFRNCQSLTSIPAWLLDNCTAVKYFISTFYNCRSLTSAVPELWNAAKWPNVTSYDDCFGNCTNAANYADIPADWK